MAKEVKKVTDQKAKKKKLTAILCGTLIPVAVIGGGIGGYAIYNNSQKKNLVLTMECSSNFYIVNNIKAKKTYNITLKLDSTKMDEGQKLKKLAFYKTGTSDIIRIIEFNGITYNGGVVLENWTVNLNGEVVCTTDADVITKDTGNDVEIHVKIETTDGAYAKMEKES